MAFHVFTRPLPNSGTLFGRKGYFEKQLLPLLDLNIDWVHRLDVNMVELLAAEAMFCAAQKEGLGKLEIAVLHDIFWQWRWA